MFVFFYFTNSVAHIRRIMIKPVKRVFSEQRLAFSSGNVKIQRNFDKLVDVSTKPHTYSRMLMYGTWTFLYL